MFYCVCYVFIGFCCCCWLLLLFVVYCLFVCCLVFVARCCMEAIVEVIFSVDGVIVVVELVVDDFVVAIAIDWCRLLLLGITVWYSLMFVVCC